MRGTHAALAAACCFWALCCTGLTSADTTPVAIEIVSPPDTIAVNDTVPIHVRVLNRGGDSIPDAPVTLTTLKDTIIGVDSTRVAIIGTRVGSDSVIVSSGSLPAAPFRVIVK